MKNEMITEKDVLSPVLREGITNFMIDIDGTICDDISNERPDLMITAKEFPGAKDWCNSQFDKGHIITFFTSRTEKEHGDITRKWLNEHGFKYNGILFGKPRGGNYHWVDNAKLKSTYFTGIYPND